MQTSFIKSIMRPASWGASPVILPLRAFLAVSFLWAGFDKFTDPAFFNSASNAYIGAQLQAYTADSPLVWVLTNIAVPNATLFGLLVAAGEVAIGLGTLFGLLSRPAAFFGLLLSLTFWLTASWTTQPFYYGADLPFAIGWLTLLLAGPHPLYSLDGLFSRANSRYAAGAASLADSGDMPTLATEPKPAVGVNRKEFIGAAAATTFSVFVAAFVTARDLNARSQSQPTNAANTAATTPTAAPAVTYPATAILAPSETATPTVAPANPTTSNQPATETPAVAIAPTTTAPTTAPAPTSKATATQAAKPGADAILAIDTLAVGSAKIFTIPNSKQKGIIVHYKDGSIGGFSAVCTHSGCTVGYDGSANQMQCPCHGAAFDGSTGDVLQGPARRALARLNVSLDPATKTVYYTK